MNERDRALLAVFGAARDWRCPGYLCGTAMLVACGLEAIDAERSGKHWTPLGVCQKCAADRRRTQRNVWATMCYALERSAGPETPGKAIRAMVERWRQNGKDDSVA